MSSELFLERNVFRYVEHCFGEWDYYYFELMWSSILTLLSWLRAIIMRRKYRIFMDWLSGNGGGRIEFSIRKVIGDRRSIRGRWVVYISSQFLHVIGLESST